MLTQNDEILNTIEAYDEEYVMNYNQLILTEVALNNEMFNDLDVESILNIFSTESMSKECYIDEDNEILNHEYITNHPELVHKMIEDYYCYY